MQYNDFFRNDVILSRFSHDAIDFIFLYDSIWKWVQFSDIVSFPVHIVLFPIFYLDINNIFYCYHLMVGIPWLFSKLFFECISSIWFPRVLCSVKVLCRFYQIRFWKINCACIGVLGNILTEFQNNFYHCFHFFGGTIADLGPVSVENLVKAVLSRKMLIK